MAGATQGITSTWQGSFIKVGNGIGIVAMTVTNKHPYLECTPRAMETGREIAWNYQVLTRSRHGRRSTNTCLSVLANFIG